MEIMEKGIVLLGEAGLQYVHYKYVELTVVIGFFVVALLVISYLFQKIK